MPAAGDSFIFPAESVALFFIVVYGFCTYGGARSMLTPMTAWTARPDQRVSAGHQASANGRGQRR
jgi:hypothetical protein